MGSPEAKRERSPNPVEASGPMSSQFALLEVQFINDTDIIKGRWLAAATKLSCSSTPIKKGLAPMDSAKVVIEETADFWAVTLGMMQ